MARQVAWILAVGLACVPGPVAADESCERAGAVSAGNGHQQPRRQDEGGRRRKWWIEAAPRAEIGIGDEQSARIEAIFQAHVPAMRERYREIEKLETTVNQLVKEGTADPVDVERQVERLERLSADSRTARIMMIYRIHRELSSDQRAKLKAMEARREAERRDAERRKSSEPKSPGRGGRP
jgi:Spy/CpxP family protein refolding chaperone